MPNAPQMLLAALQDVANVLHNDTAAADKIAVDTVKLPPGILTAAVDSKRLNMIVEPAWEPPTRKSIIDMMERAVKAGFYEKMPDEKIIYALNEISRGRADRGDSPARPLSPSPSSSLPGKMLS